MTSGIPRKHPTPQTIIQYYTNHCNFFSKSFKASASMNIQTNTMASDRSLSGDKISSPKGFSSQEGLPKQRSSPTTRQVSSFEVAKRGVQQHSKTSQASPAASTPRRNPTSTGAAPNGSLSIRNLIATAAPRSRGSTSQLSISPHSSTAALRAGTAPRRSRSGDTTVMESSLVTNRTATSSDTNSDRLSTSALSLQSRVRRTMRDRSLDRSVSSRESVGSQRSLSSRESLGSNKSMDHSSHKKDMQERIKQSAPLRAAIGGSSRSFRSLSSDDGIRSSLMTRVTSAEGRKVVSSLPGRNPATRSSYVEGRTLINRRPLRRSLSSNGLGASSGPMAPPPRRRSLNQNLQPPIAKTGTSPVSSDVQKEVIDLQQQIPKVQKGTNNDSNCESDSDSEALAIQKQLAEIKQILKNLDKPQETVSPLVSSGKLDNHEYLMKSSSPSLVSDALEDVILSIGKNSASDENSVHSSDSTLRWEEIESCRRERNDDGTRKRSRSRLDELRQSRNHQELQLRDLVKKQHATTAVDGDDNKAVDSSDVMKVIVNLRDELAAAQQVIGQQRVILQAMSEQTPPKTEPKESSETISSSLGGWFSSAPKEKEKETEPQAALPPDTVSKKQYEDLQCRFTKLQMDRAWAEYQLRDRITSDALKFHRRLRHWKDQNIELRCTIQNMENDHAQELVVAQKRENEKIAELKREHEEKLEQLQEETKSEKKDLEKVYQQQLVEYKMEADKSQQQADLAKQDLADYRKTTEMAFDEFCDAKDRIDELELELEQLKGSEDGDSDERPPRRKDRRRLTRRVSKKSLSDAATDETAESGGLTGYLSSWYYGAPTESNPDTGEEKMEEPSMSATDLTSRSHRSSTLNGEGDQEEKASTDDKTSWGTWDLTTYFHKDEKPDHEMNLTD